MDTEEPQALAYDRQQIETWIDEAKQGSSSALDHLLAACRDHLLRLANRKVFTRLKTKVSASDLLQETSLDAHRDFAGFRGRSLEELLAWLRQILLCNAANARRHYERTAKRRVSREIPLESHGAVVESLADDALSPRSLLISREESDTVQRAMDRLSADHRTVVLLRSREHLSFVEIGDLMVRSADAARKLWFRAVERLQQELAENENGRSRS